MKEYEIVTKNYNACGGPAHAQTRFEEMALNDPADYVKMKHGKEFEKFTFETIGNQIIYRFDNGAVFYIYEFTEL